MLRHSFQRLGALVVLFAAFTACPPPSPPTPIPPTSTLTVASSSRIISFDNPATVDGNVLPSRAIWGAATELNGALDVVAKGDHLYVANFGSSTITVYPVAAHGNVAPARSISGPNSLIANPSSLALMPGSDRLYVSSTASDASVLIFAKISTQNFDGDVAPERKFGSAAITVSGISDMCFDAHDNLYVANGNSILVFANASVINGPNVAPTRTITSTFGVVTGLFVTPDDTLFVTDGAALLSFVNAPALTGEVTPSTKVVGLAASADIVVDKTNRGYVSQPFPGGDQISSYDAVSMANANTPPTRVIGGPNTGLSNLNGLFMRE